MRAASERPFPPDEELFDDIEPEVREDQGRDDRPERRENERGQRYRDKNGQTAFHVKTPNAPRGRYDIEWYKNF